MTGYDSKRQMAADKLQETVSFPCCGYTDATAIKWNQFNGVVQCHMCGQVYTAAQPAQEPDYWLGYGLQAHTEKPFENATALYITPPQRPWVELTPEETSGFTQHEMTVVKYVSKVLQEKNT